MRSREVILKKFNSPILLQKKDANITVKQRNTLEASGNLSGAKLNKLQQTDNFNSKRKEPMIKQANIKPQGTSIVVGAGPTEVTYIPASKN